jgi:diaminopimelate epimerase
MTVSLQLMMTFYKYHGTGNDFIIIDDRDNTILLTTEQVAALCHRRYGIGADGLMLLRSEPGYDFRMVYYNSDGGESTMCGNGGRCLVAFAARLGLISDGKASFIAIDGPHTATIADGLVSLHMKDVDSMDIYGTHTILNTGSPHYVVWVDDVATADVYNEGKRIRYSAEFAPGGTNVNFVQRHNDKLSVRTYERGVEDETLSCGTGVTAAAIAATGTATGDFNSSITTPGGDLTVSFTKNGPTSAIHVILTGPAVFVYQGMVG